MSGLPERVIQTVVTEFPIRRRSERMTRRLRAPLSLVALFVAVAVVAGAMIGGRLVQDWNAWRNGAPAGDQAVVRQLEAVPLHLPTLKAGDACPDGPEANGLMGGGPVFFGPGWSHPASPAELTGSTSTQWGTYAFMSYLAGVNQGGPILARALDLRTNKPVAFVGNYATGPTSGTDAVDGKLVQRHSELLLEINADSPRSASGKQFEWPVIVGFAKGSSDCVGWQADGPGFTEVWVTYLVNFP
jgi:hypothetical protein